MNGPFQAGAEYYVALSPGTRQLQLVFNDDGGESRSVISTSLDFIRGRVADIGTLPLNGDFYAAGSDEIPEAQLYMEANSGYKPFTVAVVPDGYTKDELPEYVMRARSAIDYLFDIEPYKTYKSFFNVWILSAASNESGASVTDGKGNVTISRDTRFGSKFGENTYSDMSVDRPVLNEFLESACPDIANGSYDLKDVPVLVLVNDERYGGICYFGPGHGYCMVTYAYGGKRIKWPHSEIIAVSDSDPSAGTRPVTEEDYAEAGLCRGDWRNLVSHELGGHCIAHLLDEYWFDTSKEAITSMPEHSYEFPAGLNISAAWSPTPWQDDLMSRRDELIALNPLYARIGSFQGGYLSVLNRWRSEFISCMDDNRPYFSTWQRIIIARRICAVTGAPFDLQEFFSRDVIFDPVRDAAASPRTSGPYHPYDPADEAPRPIPPVITEY